MNKVQEYLRNKEIAAKGYPTMYVVKSTPEGVEEVKTVKVTDIKLNTGTITGSDFASPKLTKSYDTYILDSAPHEVDLIQGNLSTTMEGHGSGIGDLWCWTYFSTTSKTVADKYFLEETKRVNEKYLNK